jgi:OOP family OmpA-OmpF porin
LKLLLPGFFSAFLIGNAGGAFAQTPDVGKWYAGLSAGSAAVRFEDDFLKHSASNGAESFTKDETSGALKVYAGHRLFRHFALEGGYASLGRFSAGRTFQSIALFGPGSVDFDFKAHGLFLDAVGIVPVGERFVLFGKAGLMYVMSSANFRSTGSVNAAFPGAPRNAKESEITPRAGLGAGFRISRSFGLRLEYDHTFAVGDDARTGEGDVAMMSLGVIYSFQ